MDDSDWLESTGPEGSGFPNVCCAPHVSVAEEEARSHGSVPLGVQGMCLIPSHNQHICIYRHTSEILGFSSSSHSKANTALRRVNLIFLVSQGI